MFHISDSKTQPAGHHLLRTLDVPDAGEDVVPAVSVSPVSLGGSSHHLLSLKYRLRVLPNLSRPYMCLGSKAGREPSP